MPLYSASVLDNATISCFLLLHEMPLLSSEKTKLDVERGIGNDITYIVFSLCILPLNVRGLGTLCTARLVLPF